MNNWRVSPRWPERSGPPPKVEAIDVLSLVASGAGSTHHRGTGRVPWAAIKAAPEAASNNGFAEIAMPGPL